MKLNKRFVIVLLIALVVVASKCQSLMNMKQYSQEEVDSIYHSAQENPFNRF